MAGLGAGGGGHRLAAAAVSSLPLRDYFGHATARFISSNALFHTVYQLPGVFDATPDNRSLSAVNGSWWTIPIEGRCYVYLALLGAIGLRHRALSLVALAVTTMVYVRDPGMAHFYVVFFMSGVCATQFAQELRRHWKIATGVGLACVAAALAMHLPRLAEWAIVAPLTLLLGLRSTPGLRSAARFGDLSYGIYIYAYFVQQLTTHLWPTTPTFAATTAVAAVITAIAAWCSWHAVEAPALRLKRRLHRWFPDAAV